MAIASLRSWLSRPALRTGVRAWFRARGVPERGAITLGHRRVYILPTRLGVIFGATLAIMLVGSINYALSLGFMLTFLLAGMALAGMVHTVRNLANLVIVAGRAEPVFAGESAQFRLCLENSAPYARPAVMARHDASGAQTVVDVPAGGAVDVVLPVRAQRRGWLVLTRVRLETRYPLGLFRAWSYVHPDHRCLVYPRPEHTPLPAASADANAGASRLIAQGTDDFSGLRGYQSSDSPRHVAWKAVARGEDMYTKQFSGQAAAELWLDWALFSAAADLETRLSRLAGWVLAAESAGARYGLRLPGTEIPLAHGEAHHTACLAALALFEP